jgi:hypothetical protein
LTEGKRKERELGRKVSERDGEERQKKNNMKDNQESMTGRNK